MDIRKKYITIQGWMVSDLHLSGLDLLAYALIYGFCQDDETCFYGSLSYITEWLGCNKSTTSRVIQRLVDNGLIIKSEYYVQNVKFCKYTINAEGICKMQHPSANCNEVYANCNGGICKMQPYNINNNIIDNIENIDSAQNEKFELTPPPVENEKEKEKKVAPKKRKSYKPIGQTTLMAESEFYKDMTADNADADTIAQRLHDWFGPDYNEIDLYYYFNVTLDWSKSSGKVKVDWPATMRNIIRNSADKLKKRIMQQPQTSGLQDWQRDFLQL